ncbi:MAG TPA: MDR family MFS transporter [Ktedonobacteraceae bacterium]|nr:MDR family MFS transporter [Ktedonobacteraceae bacterium]
MQETVLQKSADRLHGVALYGMLVALLFTLFLEALDNTIIGPAMPRIIGQFRGFDRYSWVATAYLLTSTIMMPIVGKLSDQFGRKWFLLIGASIFLLGSALTGAAQSMDQLIVFRAVQGLGAGTGMTLVSIIIGDIFPQEERAKWQSSVNIVFAVANLIGPGAGGWLTDHGPLLGSLITASTRWRWIFYLNLPLGIVVLTALAIYLPANSFERSHDLRGWDAIRRIDFTGALLSSVATVCLLLGLTWGSNQIYDWYSPQVIGILLAASVLTILFLLAERRAAEPILPLNLFRNRVFAADSALSLLVYMIILGLAIYLPLYLQKVLGVSATTAGLMMTPYLLSLTVGGTLAGKLVAISKRHLSVVVVGTLITALGVFFLTQMTPATSLLLVVACMVVTGPGIGSIFLVIYLTAQYVLPPTQLGTGYAVIRYVGQIGSTLGVAIVWTVVNQSLSSGLVVAIQRGFMAVLAFCGVAILVMFLLKGARTSS